jgi:hypothetical protein
MYCSRRPHKPPLGFRFTGTTFSGSINWLMTSLGSLIGFRTASWCQRQTHLAILFEWAIHGQICIWEPFHRCYTIQAFGENMENLDTC